MKIVISDGLPAPALDRLREADWVIDARGGRSIAELAADLADADALVIRSATKVTKELIDAAPKLRVIARAGTGVDNVDVPAATARGIVVMNAPGANSVSVAEHAVALMLALARAIPAADASMKASKWEKSRFSGAEIRSKTLGVVGLGRVGQEVATRAHAFDMQVLAHDPFISSQVASDLGVELVSLDELCAEPTTSRSICRRFRRRNTCSAPSGWRCASGGCASSIRRAAILLNPPRLSRRSGAVRSQERRSTSSRLNRRRIGSWPACPR